MKITVEHFDTKCSVEVEREDLTFAEVVDELIRPAFLAVGFQESTLDNHLGFEGDMEDVDDPNQYEDFEFIVEHGDTINRSNHIAITGEDSSDEELE